MKLEAVWLKDGKEIYCLDSVIELTHNGNDIDSIEVYNGWGYYKSVDVRQFTGEKPNGFLIRVRRENET